MKLSQSDELEKVEGNADLTRWNRAGLDRFRYTSHGAAEFNEALRIAHMLLYERGMDPADILPPEYWREAEENGTYLPGHQVGDLRSLFSRVAMAGTPPSMTAYRDKLLAQYQATLTDPSDQISRAFARALHVLSETLDAYANEGTLRTATQPKHAMGLLSLIGFRPTPAASAIVPISYQVKPDQARVTLPEGTAFDYPLPDGGPNLSFESLESVQVHRSLNAMLPFGHDNRKDPIAVGARKFTLVEPSVFSNALQGTVAVIQGGSAPEAVAIKNANAQTRLVELERTTGHATDGDLQTCTLMTAHTAVWGARPRAGWVHFDTAPETFPDAIVYAETFGGQGDYYRVKEVRGRDIYVTSLSSPFKVTGDFAVAVSVSQAQETVIDALTSADQPGYVLGATARTTGVYELAAEAAKPSSSQIKTVRATITGTKEQAEDGFVEVNPAGLFSFLQLGAPKLWLKPGADLGALDLSLSQDSVYVENTEVEAFLKHDFLVFELSNGDLFASSFSVAQHDRDSSAIIAQDVSFDHAKVIALYAGFSGTSAFVAETQSPDPLLVQGDMIKVICPASERDMLKLGKTVLVEKTDGSATIEGQITEVENTVAAYVSLALDTGTASLAGFTKGNSLLHGNVATFGHGKSLPPRVLGSGDAGQQAQDMPIEEEAISTRLNAGFPGGVAVDIQVSVEGRTWQQIAPDTANAGAGPNYSVLQQSDGKTFVRFHQLLPSGTDNVMLSRVRVGAGKFGNDIPAYGVANLQPKHSSIERVVQPIASQGGADRQGVEGLRSSGKSRYALFDRALATEDFARLAESHTGVLHASAELIRQGLGRGGNIVRLTIAPSGGADLLLIQDQLETLLLNASLPGTVVEMIPFVDAQITGECTIHLLAGFADVHTIRDALQAILMTHFGLEMRALGKALYGSEIAAAIESHPAVDYVSVDLDPICETISEVRCERSVDGAVQAYRPSKRACVYLKDFAGFTLDILSASTGGT